MTQISPARIKTAKTTHADLIAGDKLYLKRARKALPYLVRQAKSGKTIYYSDLAVLVDIPNPRNLNYVLGAIGNALIDLGKRTKIAIPPIQCLVVNKRDELPGDGIEWFIATTEFSKLNKTQKQNVVAVQLTKIYTFQHWDWVLEQLNLNPIKTDLSSVTQTVKNRNGGGESIQHKKFKEYILKNPKAIGLYSDLIQGQTEYQFPSADAIDVLFVENDLTIGVEVKSIISDTADIYRGIFQCVKYKHLIEAEQIVCDKIPNSRVLLVLQGKFPEELLLIKNILGVEVLDNISIVE